MGLFRKAKRILCLGGGSARGFSNIGVLKVFERHFGRGKLPFDKVIGTSVGSLIGAAYCLGMPVEELEDRAKRLKWQDIVDLYICPTGVLKGDKLQEIIRDCIGDSKFEDCTIPFALTTTDLETGEEQAHTSGDLARLVRASCSWPGIFSAVEVDGRVLVDGGVRNSIPTKDAYNFGATFVVAVDPGFSVKTQKIKNVLTAIVQSVQIMGEELNSYQAGRSDLAIKPDLPGVDQFDFDKTAYIISQGEIAAEGKMRKLKRKLFFHR